MKRFVQEAVERMTPRKPKAITDKNSGACPSCGSLVHRFERETETREIKNCKWCGQALEWNAEEL